MSALKKKQRKKRQREEVMILISTIAAVLEIVKILLEFVNEVIKQN